MSLFSTEPGCDLIIFIHSGLSSILLVVKVMIILVIKAIMVTVVIRIISILICQIHASLWVKRAQTFSHLTAFTLPQFWLPPLWSIVNFHQHLHCNHCHTTAGSTEGMNLLLSRRRKSFMLHHAPPQLFSQRVHNHHNHSPSALLDIQEPHIWTFIKLQEAIDLIVLSMLLTTSHWSMVMRGRIFASY